jgi:hypothetical protein
LVGASSMSEQPEEVKGVIPAFARLALGSERLNLYVTNRRIIVAHIGKRGAGAVVGTSFLGRLSGAFEDLLKSGRESRSRGRLDSSKPMDILRADKDNFPLLFGEIVRVDVDEGPGSVGISVLSRDDKFDFITRMDIDGVLGLLSDGLGVKLTARRLNK